MSRQLPRVVAGVLVDPFGMCLVGRRISRWYDGHWEFPGGKVEDGEGFKEALAREWMEELNAEVEVGEMVYCGVIRLAAGRRCAFHAYRVATHAPRLALRVHSELMWLKPSKVLALSRVTPSTPFIARALARQEMTNGTR